MTLEIHVIGWDRHKRCGRVKSVIAITFLDYIHLRRYNSVHIIQSMTSLTRLI
jgi:hypothetical protein